MLSYEYLVFGLAGCQSAASGEGTQAGTETGDASGSEVVKLKVWAEEGNFDMLKGMVETFKQAHAGEVTLEVEFIPQGDADTRDSLLSDVHAAPDIFHFPDDQLNSLISGGVLSKVPNAEEVKKANVEGSVEAASLNGTLYAYPMTADNGYFLYYDKDYFTEEDVKTFDGILRAAEKAGKTVAMEFNSGWYLYSFFGGAGLELGLNDDGVTNYCNWNTTSGKYTGMDVVNALHDIASSPAFKSKGNDDLVAGIQDGSVIAGISGVWNAMAVREAWGDDYGAVKLPTYTCKGEQVQMSSFTGYKMIGVNSYSENVEWAHKLADWFTNEENQTIRFVKLNQGPSNIKAAASDEVLKVPAIQAIIAQSEYGKLQRVGNNYWAPCTEFIDTLLKQKMTQADLDSLVAKITESTVR